MKRRFFLKAAATALVGFSLFKKPENYATVNVVEFSYAMPFAGVPYYSTDTSMNSWLGIQRKASNEFCDSIKKFTDNKLKAAQY